MAAPFIQMPSALTFQSREQQAYSDWKSATSGWAKDQALEKLLKTLDGPIHAAINVFRAAPMPQATMELEAKRIAVQAIKGWDSSAGMTLGPYVGTQVRQKLYRYVATYQNVGRIPEEQVGQIGKLNVAIEGLGEKLGREPTTEELADHLAIPTAHVARLRKSLRKDIFESSVEEEGFEAVKSDLNFERAMMAYYGMNDQEKQVFDFALGAHGQPKLSPGDMAKRLGVGNSRISALKESVARKIQPYLVG
jgi:RNA polymerase primary sigma factor